MKYKLIKSSELEELLRSARNAKQDERDEAYNRGYEDGKDKFASEVEELEESVDEKNAENKKLRKQVEYTNAEISVLREDKTKARDVIAQKLANENTAADLNAREDSIIKREAKIRNREDLLESRVSTEDDKRYKEGYADGVADGVRKISEITQVDRQNAMDIAMVSAASHTKPEIVKEVLDGSKAIKPSLTNKEDK